MPRIIRVDVLSDYRLDLTFDDGVAGTVDLADRVGDGVFVVWLTPGVFRDVHIGSAGELAWGNEIDLCADALYLEVTGKRPEEVFPSLRCEPVRA